MKYIYALILFNLCGGLFSQEECRELAVNYKAMGDKGVVHKWSSEENYTDYIAVYSYEKIQSPYLIDINIQLEFDRDTTELSNLLYINYKDRQRERKINLKKIDTISRSVNYDTTVIYDSTYSDTLIVYDTTVYIDSIVSYELDTVNIKLYPFEVTEDIKKEFNYRGEVGDVTDIIIIESPQKETCPEEYYHDIQFFRDRNGELLYQLGYAKYKYYIRNTTTKHQIEDNTKRKLKIVSDQSQIGGKLISIKSKGKLTESAKANYFLLKRGTVIKSKGIKRIKDDVYHITNDNFMILFSGEVIYNGEDINVSIRKIK